MAQHELSEPLYANVGNWSDYPGFSEAERIALEDTEKFASDHQALDAAFFERLEEDGVAEAGADAATEGSDSHESP